MRRLLGHTLVAVLGAAAGAALVLIGLYLFPFPHVTRAERVLPGFGAGKVLEVYSFEGRIDRPSHLLSITHDGTTPFALQPAGIQLMQEPAIRAGLALITRLRDARGQVVGIATELESGHEDSSLLAGKLMTHTTWTAVLPGRGALVLYQVEDNWWLATRIIGPTLLRGEPWRGSWRNLNTLGPLPNGHGRIVAATGAFAARPGTFVETAEMREFTPSGAMDFTMDLRLALEPRAGSITSGAR